MWKIVFWTILSVPVAAWCVMMLLAAKTLALSRRALAVLGIVLAASLCKFEVFWFVGGRPFHPDLPQGTIWFFSWAYAAALMLCLFSVIAATCDLALRIVHRPVAVRTKRICAIALSVIAAAVSLWGIYEGMRVPSVKRVEVSWRELPAAFDGYRIVHMSDLHCSSAVRKWRFVETVARVNALKPDLVAITGDFIDGSVRELGDDISPLADIRAVDGVVCCSGNHEAFYNWREWLATFRGWGFEFPEVSGVRTIRRGGDSIAVGGMEDPKLAMTGLSSRAGGKAADAFRGASEGAFRILMFHRPLTDAIGAKDADVRLQLSGHTHGGAMPIMDLLVARFNEGRTRGLYEFAPGRFLYLSPGTGQWSGFPLRLFNPAEITEIVLHRISM